jgi:hypothetical protein
MSGQIPSNYVPGVPRLLLAHQEQEHAPPQFRSACREGALPAHCNGRRMLLYLMW